MILTLDFWQFLNLILMSLKAKYQKLILTQGFKSLKESKSRKSRRLGFLLQFRFFWLRAPGGMFLISSLAHVINTRASTCSIHTCQHVQYTHVLARVLYTRASTCTIHTCQHVYYTHVLARVYTTRASTCVYYTCSDMAVKCLVLGLEGYGTDFKVKVEVLFCMVNLIILVMWCFL